MDNCLEWNLKFWSKNKQYKLYYNSDHVIALESKYVKVIPDTYLPLESFGFDYFLNAFKMKNLKTIIFLKEYLDSHNTNV